jgi:hypothetical protein
MATEREGAGAFPGKAPMRLAAFLLLLLCASHAQAITQGGNVTALTLTLNNLTDKWDGLYGQVVLGSGASLSYVVGGGNITRVNFIGQEPPCTDASEILHIVAVNATSLTAPLQPGNLSTLDALMGMGANASASFTQNGSFSLSYGNFSGVPELFTFAGNSTSPDFREGYLNDALGNLVFVADVVGAKPDWNGTTSDYQLMLPLKGVNYTLFVDVAYSCPLPPPPPPPGGNTHRLYILPAGPFNASPGSALDAEFFVRNTGGYIENNIALTLSCPAGFSCGAGSIAHLAPGGQANATLPITVDGPGEFVLTVCAGNANTRTCRDFIVRVVPECVSSGECGAGGFCQNNACEPKKKPGERCDDAGQCLNGVCTRGVCGTCASDSDCPDDGLCSAGSCVKVECQCGVVGNHSCASYACCADTDCGRCQICSGNACLDRKFDILLAAGALEGMVEGQPVRVQVLGNDGRGVAGARVYTSEMQAYADANGYATITVPYDGIIYASANCYPNAGVMFTIVRKGSFIAPQAVLVGANAIIRLVDSKGRPIAGASVDVDGAAAATDSNGEFRHAFATPGRKTISARVIGYDIPDVTVDVSLVYSCGYPVLFGFWSFGSDTVWELWALSIVLAIFNFLMLRRVMGRKEHRQTAQRTMLQLAYAFLPLIIAAIPFFGLGICLMSNVVALQFLAGLVALIVKEIII